MNRYKFSLLKFSLSLFILFSFPFVVKAEDYELIIITPSKYETIAQQFLHMHSEVSDWSINGVYATVEDIFARYDKALDGVGGINEPTPASGPDLPSLTEEQIGKQGGYENDVSLSIIKFLRGILLFRGPGRENSIVIGGTRREFEFAFDALRDEHGVPIPENDWLLDVNPDPSDDKLPKFKYLLILGDTGAAGPATVTLNGVPESWYAWMDVDTYGEETGPDDTWFPTDFFYASPDYYTGIDWVPNLSVGRLPIHDFGFVADAIPPGNTGRVTEIITVVDVVPTLPPLPYNPPLGLVECDVCDSTHATQPGSRWTDNQWAGYELWIVNDGNPPPAGDLAPVGGTYLILSNTDTCLRVLGEPEDLEEDNLTLSLDGDGYEIHDTGLYDEAQDIFDKCHDYDAEIKADHDAAWNNWYRNVVTVGGDSHPTLFSFWDEFVCADITNQGFFEGNEITKLRHTNKDDGGVGPNGFNDFNAVSVAPYLNDTDCGLLFHLGLGFTDSTFGPLLYLDGPSIITATQVLASVATDSRIPIMVSNSGWYWDGNGRFDILDVATGRQTYSFGEAAVESVGGGGGIGGAIAFIGSTDIAYSGIMPSFNEGVVEQARFYNMDELLSYTMQSFHSAPKYLGDIFTGSPNVWETPSGEPGLGPINQFIANNDIGVEAEYWHLQKTIFEYVLLGDPCLPVPYPQSKPIKTYTEKPVLTFDENTLRSQLPLYESHGIGVDEIPTGDHASTTIDIAPVNEPEAVVSVKKTKIDIRRDITAVGDYYAPAAPGAFTFDTPNTTPGYYLIRVEQPGYDNGFGWGNWWEKETWIYVQEVNEFPASAHNNILVVDDDWGYPIVTYPGLAILGNSVYGYEDWYLRALDPLIATQLYDVWHVDFDDSYTTYAGGADDWVSSDLGTTQMHGEVYEGLLNTYSKVIWLTGNPAGYWRPNDYLYPTEGITEWNVETLTPAEQARLINYLVGSGRLFLSGQGILWDLGCSGFTEAGTENLFCERKHDTSPITNTFLTNYLHITDLYSAFSRGYNPVIANVSSSDVISGNLTIDIAGYDGAQNQYLFASAEPSVDTPVVSRVFEYTSYSGDLEDMGDTPFFGTAGTAHYQGRDASVFLPWGFEAIDRQTDRNEIMAMIISWLDDNDKEPTGSGTDPDSGPEPDPDPGDPNGPDGSGGGDGVGSLSGCFIATACYGTPMAKEVRVLSNFRDEYLMSNYLGKFFVGTYYRVSPQIASFISEHPYLKNVVRWFLKPLVKVADKTFEG